MRHDSLSYRLALTATLLLAGCVGMPADDTGKLLDGALARATA